jgi:hypothetical protein
MSKVYRFHAQIKRYIIPFMLIGIETVHSIEEAQQFLLATPKHFWEWRNLGFQPNIPFLKWLPDLPFEAALYFYQQTDWILVRGEEFGVNNMFTPQPSNPKIHSHFKDNTDGSIPSIRDFNLISNPKQPPYIPGRPYIPVPQDNGANLVISETGLTQYWPVVGEYNRRLLASEDDPERFRDFRFGKGREKEFLEFLTLIEARYQIYPWEKLDEEKLAELLTPNTYPIDSI